MQSRQNPLGIEATGQIQVDLSSQVMDLHRRVISAEEDRHRWLDKQRILIEQRRGIPKAKTVPWAGANNDSWPLSDGVVRRWKPGIMGLILDADPVAYFLATKPQDLEASQSAMAFYHWKFRQIPGLTQTAMELTDLIAQHGLAYTRQGWDYRTAKRCRVARADELFPGGVDAAVASANQAIQQQNDALMRAQAAGQPTPPGAQVQPPVEPAEYVSKIMELEYKLGPEDMSHSGRPMLEEATELFLAGAKHVKIYHTITETDTMSWRVLSPLDVLVPNKSVPIGRTDWVAVLHRMPSHQILQMAQDGIFIPEAAALVVEKMAKTKQHDSSEEDAGFTESRALGRSGISNDLSAMEGVSSRQNNDEPGLAPIWELYCKLDLDGSGLVRKCVVWYDPSSKTVLSATEYPFPFQEWPIAQFEFEHTSARPYSSRGICELLSTFQKQTNKLHNARLDAIQVLLSPMMKMRSVNGQNTRNIRFRPGAIIPVADVNDLQPLIQDFRPLVEFIREENYTKGLAEQYIGVFDQTLLNSLSDGGNERRTAAEVNAVTAQISAVFGQDAALFQSSMATVHRQLWQLWQDFGDDEEYFHVLGEEAPRTVRKVDISRDYDIFPAGTPANTNKALALARTREMIQLFAPDQTGLINKHALYKQWFDLTDRNASKIILRSEEEAAAVQQVLQAASATTGGKVTFPAF